MTRHAISANEQRGDGKGKNCFFLLHDDASFGLGWKDRHALFGGTQRDAKQGWIEPTPTEAKEHAKQIATVERMRKRPYQLRNESVSITHPTGRTTGMNVVDDTASPTQAEETGES